VGGVAVEEFDGMRIITTGVRRAWLAAFTSIASGREKCGIGESFAQSFGRLAMEAPGGRGGVVPTGILLRFFSTAWGSS